MDGKKIGIGIGKQMTATSQFDEILRDLDLARGDLVFIHSSGKYLTFLGLPPQALLERILEAVGSNGTVVMPAYWWNFIKGERLWAGFAKCFQSRPIFDVKHSRPNIGILPELFLSLPETERSFDYWWSVGAHGPLAKEITRDQSEIRHFCGPHSAFDRMRQRGVKIVGLGVTQNTTALAVLVDYALGERHPQTVFTPNLQSASMRDEHGREVETRGNWLIPEVVRLIKPGVLFERSQELRESCKFLQRSDSLFFSYPFEVYYREGIRLGLAAAAAGDRVPWLANYPLTRLS